jgi:hypothetical protein
VRPETADGLLLAENQVAAAPLLGQLGEGAQSAVGARLDEGGVADERDAFQVSCAVATGVERAAVEGTLKAVVADQAAHDDRRRGALGQKVEHLLLAVSFGQGVDAKGGLGIRRDARGRGLSRFAELGHHVTP